MECHDTTYSKKITQKYTSTVLSATLSYIKFSKITQKYTSTVLFEVHQKF